MGGAPDSGPMQAVGGTRGARQYWGDDLDSDRQVAGLVDEFANRSLPNIPSDSVYRDSGMWTTYSGFTLRDQIREEEANSSEAIPLQFRYEAADCRLYYTLKDLYNMTQQWRDVSKAMWDDSSLCVKGSTGYSAHGNGTVTVKPPVANMTALFTPFQNMSASATFQDITTSDTDPNNNQFDGVNAATDKIVLCTNGKCPGALKAKCVTVSISCSSSGTGTSTGTGNKPATSVEACLPARSDNQACKAYDRKSQEHLVCWKDTSSEETTTKAQSKVTKLIGANKSVAVIDSNNTSIVKRCRPSSGMFNS